VARGEEEGCERAFQQRGGVGECICRPVAAEEKGGDGGRAGVVLRRGPEFEEVEDAEERDEQRGPPQGTVGLKENEEGCR